MDTQSRLVLSNFGQLLFIHPGHVWGPRSNSSFWPLKPFFQAVQESSIRQERSRLVDIQPIIQHFHGLCPNHSMALYDLTMKVLLAPWRLRFNAFLRHRTYRSRRISLHDLFRQVHTQKPTKTDNLWNKVSADIDDLSQKKVQTKLNAESKFLRESHLHFL